MWADKAHFILLNPITWGIATLIIAAIAFSGRFSVNLSNFFLLCAFFVGCFGIFRTGHTIHACIILCLVVGLGLTLVSWWIQPASQSIIVAPPPLPQQPTAEEIAKAIIKNLPGEMGSGTKNIPPKSEGTKKESRFSVLSKTMLIFAPVLYQSNSNMWCYLIDFLICIDIVNNTSVLGKINDYYAEVLFGDEWFPIQPIPFSDKGRFFYMTDVKNRTGMEINFDKSTFEEQIKNRNLNAGETVTGLLMFGLTNRTKNASIYASKKPLRIKLFILDSLGHKEEHIIELSTERKDKDVATAGWGGLSITIKERDVDMKKFFIVNLY